MKSSSFLYTAAAILIFLLAIGSRLFSFPASINIVWGFSMYPTLKPGDLALSISTSISSYSPGDIVIYCSDPFHCTIHRVLNVSDGIVTTKGDFNPIPDPPVKRESVRYKLLLSVPAWLWISSLFILSIFSYIDIRKFEESLLSPFSLEAFVFTLVLLVLVLSFLFTVIQAPGKAAEIQLPSITLSSIGLSENKTLVVLNYNLRDLSIESVDSCSFVLQSTSFPCSASILNGTTLIAPMPADLLQALYENQSTYYQLNLSLNLDKGKLTGSYPLVISWQEPELEIENASLLIQNPNPVPLSIINSTIYYVNATSYYGSPRIEKSMSLLNQTLVPPAGSLKIEFPSQYDYAYVEVFYEFMNRTNRWVGIAEFTKNS
ncbi:MAG: signal peptidase I [Fervidicoccaceae archaeon]